MNEFDDIIIFDEDDFDDDDFRNARSGRSVFGAQRRSRGMRGGRGRRARGVMRRREPAQAMEPAPTAGPVVRKDTGGLSTGVLIEAGAQALAAIQPLPNPPLATGNVETDVTNMIRYQQALAQHAKRDEQLRTIGSLASKLFA